MTLTRQVYKDAIEHTKQATTDDSAYLDHFSFEFPNGLNTANTLEVCRSLQDTSIDARVHLMRICISGKPVKATCPNGETEEFFLTNPSDSLEGFPLFKKEPLALIALSDCIYGDVLKKSIRLSTAQKAAPEHTTEKESGQNPS